MQWHGVSHCHRVLWRLEVDESLSPNSLKLKDVKLSLLVQSYHRSSWLKKGDAEQMENAIY